MFQSTSTVVVSIAMALPDGAGIVSFALPVLSYAHLIRCGRRNNEHRACRIAAGFKISLCCTTVLCGTVWEPRYTGWDWGLSEGTLPIYQGAFSNKRGSGEILVWRTCWTWLTLESRIVNLWGASWNTLVAREGCLSVGKLSQLYIAIIMLT